LCSRTDRHGTSSRHGTSRRKDRQRQLHPAATEYHDATTDVRSPQPGVAQIILWGEHDLSTAVQLRKTLDQALASCSHLIVDVSSVQFMDSSTIKVLVNAQKAATEKDCGFNLVLSTTPLVERVLEITGVLPTLNRVHTLKEALATRVTTSTSPSPRDVDER
jgi:anti-anti-sigma factor